MIKDEIETVEKVSPNIVLEQTEQLKHIFPQIFSEGNIDFDKLRTALGDMADDQPERYSFTWAGKRNATQLLQTPSYATLIPAEDESINFESTQNLFIEGDNLEVLKLLYKSYSGRVKMIYIDPPYNTGNDFVYPDSFADPLETYLEITGQKDADGNLLTSNPETSGRYHSAWLSMMYPRLYLARQVLKDDGVIFVSIDDHEVYNLRLLMNEIFGEENFIAELVWEKTRKNDAKLFSVGHEYMLVYAQSLSTLKELKTVWREEKPGAKQIMEQYRRLRAQYGDDDKAIEKALREWYQSLPENHPSKKLNRYKNIDKYAPKYGPWRDDNISWPGGDGPRYEVIHSVTKQPCAIPEGGWRYSTPEAMERQIQLELVVFRKDHTQPPIRKTHLLPVPEELDDEDVQEVSAEEDGNDSAGMQVMPSVFNRQAQVAVKQLRALLGGTIFDNPKNVDILARLIRYCTSVTNNDIILDFFAGAGATAEAVLWLNHEDEGNRRFICVQLPEPTREKSSARKLGYSNIADIGKDRICRVIDNMKNEADSKLISTRNKPEDLGFRVFKLAPSNYKQWKNADSTDPEAYTKQLTFFTDPLVEGWSPERVIWEVAIKEGYGLNASVKQLEAIKENTVWQVADPDKGQSLLICLDNTLHPSTLSALPLTKDHIFVCLNKALDDTLAANLALQCRLKKI